MRTADLEAAIRRVMSAVNLESDQFKLDSGFVSRVLRIGKPRTLTLNDSSTLLAFNGVRPAQTSPEAARALAQEALTTLSAPARAACRQIIAAWIDPNAVALAAAYDVVDSSATEFLGASWIASTSWPKPVIDKSKSPDEAIEDALTNVAEAIGQRKDLDSTTFRARLDSTLEVVNATLRYFEGEGQQTDARPSRHGSATDWRQWRVRYEQAIRDEWRRIRGVVIPSRRSGEVSIARDLAGRLRGLRVFISYARPDALRLATPVNDVLVTAGATVWFDQRAVPDGELLDVGLYDEIGKHDAFVMCASDEYFERAGYATQELAWALQQRSRNGSPGKVVVVARRGAILPSAVSGWTRIELEDSAEHLAAELLSALEAPDMVVDSCERLSPPPAAPPPPLPVHADVAAISLRLRHARLLDRFPTRLIQRLVEAFPGDPSVVEPYAKLRRIGEDLDWSGTLEDIAAWPKDSFVRDIRLRFGASRAVIGLRQAVTHADEHESIAHDLDFLVTGPVPPVTWPVTTGWGELERRLAIRHHAGLLRVLDTLLDHGPQTLQSIDDNIIARWARDIVHRRQECHDALLDLRVGGKVGWQRDPLTWDDLFDAWEGIRLGTSTPWADQLPFDISRLLHGNNAAISALGADVVWTVAQTGGVAQEIIPARSYEMIRIAVYAAGPAAPELQTEATANEIRIGVVATGSAAAQLRLSWNAPDLYPDVGEQSTTGLAPFQLAASVNRVST